MNKPVYINDVASFLPNEPVSNEEIEDVLGMVSDIPSRTKKIMLRNNKIATRHYAIDRDTGRLTHTNAQMSAAAVQGLRPYDGFTPEDIQCLSCGTTTPDVLFPGHALMVLGELGISQSEAVTTAGICICGMTAFKYAFMNIAAGLSENAVAVGSDLASSYLRAKFFTAKTDPDIDLEKKPIRAFDAEFLRWMLSDGAGAAFLSNQTRSDRVSLRVEWIENISYAGRIETCMYAGGIKRDDGTVIGWRELEDIDAAAEQMKYLIKQDTKLLEKEIVNTAIDMALVRTIQKHGLQAEDIDWFLPHYSSHYFRSKFFEAMRRVGFEIPYDKWFTNLYAKGNTGSASIYIIIEELLKSGRLEPGQKVLCFIPESGRFSHVYMMLTVV